MLLHDSVYYFGTLLIVAIVYMIITRLKAENGEIAVNSLFPLISAFGCRLLYHIRSRQIAGVDERDGDGWYKTSHSQGLDLQVFSGQSSPKSPRRMKDEDDDE